MADHWLDLCAVEDVAPGQSRHVISGGHCFAVFRVTSGVGADALRVLDDACPHAGGSLSAGALDTSLRDPGATPDFGPAVPAGRTGSVVCPVHGWPFDLDTGRCLEAPRYRARVYPVRVVEGRVQVQVPPAAG